MKSRGCTRRSQSAHVVVVLHVRLADAGASSVILRMGYLTSNAAAVVRRVRQRRSGSEPLESLHQAQPQKISPKRQPGLLDEEMPKPLFRQTDQVRCLCEANRVIELRVRPSDDLPDTS